MSIITFLGGGGIIFTQGTYTSNGKKIKFKLDVTQHSGEQTIFGEKRKHFSTVMTGERDGDLIQGKARRKGAHSTAAHYQFRLIKLADIPEFPKKR